MLDDTGHAAYSSRVLGFDIAKRLLRSSSISVSLEPSVIEDICLTCSQEFYDNASSGNYHFGDMKLAYDW